MRKQSLSVYLLEIILLATFVTFFATGCGVASAHEEQEDGSATTPHVETTTTASPGIEHKASTSGTSRKTREAERLKRTTEVKLRADMVIEQLKQTQKTKQAAMQEKIASLKDARKKAQAEKLTSQMKHVNEKLSQRHIKFLSQIEKVLDRIEDRTDKLEAQNANITSVRTQIDAARELLTDIKEKVLAQQEKAYTVDITAEEALGQAYRTSVHQLRDDHRMLRAELKSLAQTVRATFKELKSVSSTLSPAPSSNAASE